MKRVFPLVLLTGGCATIPPSNATEQDAAAANGPWSEIPALEMPTGDTSIPIALLRDVANALLKRPGATVCDPLTRRPIAGLSTEYCSTVYIAGDRESLSWRVSEPIRGDHFSCTPFSGVKDADHPLFKGVGRGVYPQPSVWHAPLLERPRRMAHGRIQALRVHGFGPIDYGQPGSSHPR